MKTISRIPFLHFCFCFCANMNCDLWDTFWFSFSIQHFIKWKHFHKPKKKSFVWAIVISMSFFSFVSLQAVYSNIERFITSYNWNDRLQGCWENDFGYVSQLVYWPSDQNPRFSHLNGENLCLQPPPNEWIE